MQTIRLDKRIENCLLFLIVFSPLCYSSVLIITMVDPKIKKIVEIGTMALLLSIKQLKSWIFLMEIGLKVWY
ncbi:MAG: hypothetical protein NTW93_02155 [Phycisphaerae bacterium]|nr:hypothetical protein [Phycisphaerae bacterium]